LRDVGRAPGHAELGQLAGEAAAETRLRRGLGAHLPDDTRTRGRRRCDGYRHRSLWERPVGWDEETPTWPVSPVSRRGTATGWRASVVGTPRRRCSTSRSASTSPPRRPTGPASASRSPPPTTSPARSRRRVRRPTRATRRRTCAGVQRALHVTALRAPRT